ncbi:hypothetical protein ZHAS_00021295 [Anopheles sinensis]|uniref:Uncharacterized protein n=1 Tax=Anopheles sinensis TaxID=74873 RepID=A0A084WS08_ANOSI|nr:hypothetical protein ZHAS_00021295 [Anopheles sinensis]
MHRQPAAAHLRDTGFAFPANGKQKSYEKQPFSPLTARGNGFLCILGRQLLWARGFGGSGVKRRFRLTLVICFRVDRGLKESESGAIDSWDGSVWTFNLDVNSGRYYRSGDEPVRCFGGTSGRVFKLVLMP